MTFRFLWVSYRRDMRGKMHFWGLLRVGDNLDDDEAFYQVDASNFVVWWANGSRTINKTEVSVTQFLNKRYQKLSEGYKAMNMNDTVKKKLEPVIEDISMQFTMEKLSDV